MAEIYLIQPKWSSLALFTRASGVEGKSCITICAASVNSLSLDDLIRRVGSRPCVSLRSADFHCKFTAALFLMRICPAEMVIAVAGSLDSNRKPNEELCLSLDIFPRTAAPSHIRLLPH